MQLHRTDKAKSELASKERLLTVRERGALFLADGTKTQEEMRLLLQDANGLVEKLVAGGYLVAHNNPSAREAVASAPATPIATLDGEQAFTVVKKPAADSFDGKRSMASTRMFLFDICERMFVRKLPELAAQYRDQLREARDRASMLKIADEMLVTVAQIAGQDRADGLSERIALLLPIEEETA